MLGCMVKGMRSRIWYAPDPTHVEIDLCGDDFAAWCAELFDDEPQSLQDLGAAVSRFHGMLKATPDDLLEKWPVRTRQQLANVAREWAERLDPNRRTCFCGKCDYCREWWP